jgi:hypothetical protein
MLDFSPITLEQKPLFDKYFRQQRFENSHYNFTTRFIWRQPYDLQWALIDGCLCFRGHADGKYFILPPASPDREAIGSALDKLTADFAASGWPLVIRDIERPFAEELAAIRPHRLAFRKDRDNYDYVYNVEDLSELKGRLYHAKKNHANSFRRLYPDYELRPLTADLFPACQELEKSWAAGRDENDENLLAEKEAIRETFANYSALALTGAAILVGGRLVAFAIGEQLNDDTAVVHFEKADATFKGIYAVINQEYCAAYWRHLQYINRQEDLGIEGLRKAKKSYHPVKMIEKCLAVGCRESARREACSHRCR